MRRRFKITIWIDLKKNKTSEGETSDETLLSIADNIKNSILDEVLLPKELDGQLEINDHKVEGDWE